jgi:hypothetical protein
MKMTEFKNLAGYNSNKFVKENHVFIKGKGTFYETKELASKYNIKTGNEVGLFYETLEIEGREVFKELNSNVWN